MIIKGPWKAGVRATRMRTARFWAYFRQLNNIPQPRSATVRIHPTVGRRAVA